jgi:arylsulfatase A-like enzyme/tetratricopeptide (TPR) repeat protein
MIRQRASRAAALGLALLAVWGCGGRGVAPGAATVYPGAPVVLVSVDTLRSDRLPFYGYAGVETPALSALRAEATLFEKAYAHTPLTLPSHVSLFTGRLASGHGVHDNLGYSLDPKVPTLAELLQGAGYATGGAVSSVVMDRSSGVSRGFDFWDDEVVPTRAYEALNRVQRPGDEARSSLEAWISGQAGRPFFAFLHLYEPHSPYEPPEPFRSRHADPYDGEVAAADAIVGRFLDFLKEEGLYDRSLVVFLSDHGEGLGDHGEAEHGVFLYREAIQVPLLVKPPKGGAPPPASFAGPVQLTDVFTTIARAVALPAFAPPAGTVSLLEAAQGPPDEERRIFSETLFPRIHFGWSELRSLVDGRWHYVEAPRPEFYDLKEDPGEKANLVDRRPDPFRKMRIAMESYRNDFRPPAPADDEAKKQLASLGYLSSGATAGDGPLPDPKDHIATVGRMKEAVTHFTEGRHEEAARVAGELLALHPGMLEVWELRSHALARLGRMDESVEALGKAVALAPPGSTHYLRSMADRLLEAGRSDEALAHADLAKERGDPAADEVRARVLLAKGDFAGAKRAALASLDAPSNRGRGHLLLARIAVLEGDLGAALEWTDRAARNAPQRGLPPAGLHLVRGDVLARMGRHAEAEGEFREEIRAYPSAFAAWESLVLLLAAQGRAADVRKTVKALTETVPGAESYLAAARALEVVGESALAGAVRREGAARHPGETRLRPGSAPRG